jgi:acyl-coenzyme A thioesterase PaaI-like protein
MESSEVPAPAVGDGGGASGQAARPFDVRRFCRRALLEGLNGRLGLQYLSHDSSHVELFLPGSRSGGKASGWSLQDDGLIMALLDMAGTLSVWAAAGKFRPHATLDMRVDHLDGLRPGEAVRGRAGCYFLDARVASVRGSARTDQGREVASFAATYMFTG